MLSLTRLSIALLAALALTACGLSPKDGDEDYLRGLCSATNTFSDDLATAGDPATIRSAVQAYRDALAALSPEDDVATYNDSFIDYLDSLLTDPPPADPGDPPEPSSSIELRLNALAPTVDECEATDLFGQ